ncbi:MAG: hypothetical protein WBW31_01705 [Candidatus Sulfotelmatobacter sp.]
MGTLKALVGLAVLVLVVVALFQVLPPVMANYSFTDDLRQVAMMAGANPQRTDDDVRNDVLKKAKEHDLPIDEKQVTVQRILTPGLMAVYVAADYTVPINLPGYSFELHFNPSSGNK